MPNIQSMRNWVSWIIRPVMSGTNSAANDEGAATLEFALVAPLLVVLMFGIIVYGIYFCVWIAISEAAAAGARASVAGLTDAERISLATIAVTNDINSYGPMLSMQNAVVVAQDAPDSNGGAFQVSVTYSMSNFGLGIFVGLLPIPTVEPQATITVSIGGL
jgi:Flp pilus assembly protein TadG